MPLCHSESSTTVTHHFFFVAEVVIQQGSDLAILLVSVDLPDAGSLSSVCRVLNWYFRLTLDFDGGFFLLIVLVP